MRQVIIRGCDRMKIYVCRKREFMFQVILPALVAIGGGISCIVGAYLYPEHLILAVLISTICLYTIYNTFLTGSYPDKIIIADDHISFYSMGKMQQYKYCDIRYFKVRESRYSLAMFVRINKPLLNKGRFWIHANSFQDGDELYKRIVELEFKIHPKSLKSIAYQQI